MVVIAAVMTCGSEAVLLIFEVYADQTLGVERRANRGADGCQSNAFSIARTLRWLKCHSVRKQDEISCPIDSEINMVANSKGQLFKDFSIERERPRTVEKANRRAALTS